MQINTHNYLHRVVAATLALAFSNIVARTNMTELLRSTIGSRKGYLDVLLDRVAFGEGVKGTVVLHVNKAFKCRGLLLHFHGSESVTWEEYGVEGGKQKVSRTNEFLNQSITLSTFHDLEPGQYEFPFSYQLPKKLPGSFGLHDVFSSFHVSLNPRITYSVTAHVPVVKSFSFDLKTTEPLAIFPQTLNLPEQRFTKAQASTSANRDDTANKEECYLSIEPDRDSYVTGDTIQVRAYIANNSCLDVVFVRMVLIEDLLFTSTNSEEQKQGSNELIETTAQGIRAGESTHRSLFLPLVYKSNGNPINPTTPETNTLRRTYQLVVTCGIGLSQDVRVEIPVVVRPQPRPVDVVTPQLIVPTKC